jgi:hypothetical protein
MVEDGTDLGTVILDVAIASDDQPAAGGDLP